MINTVNSLFHKISSFGCKYFVRRQLHPEYVLNRNVYISSEECTRVSIEVQFTVTLTRRSPLCPCWRDKQMRITHEAVDSQRRPQLDSNLAVLRDWAGKSKLQFHFHAAQAWQASHADWMRGSSCSQRGSRDGTQRTSGIFCLWIWLCVTLICLVCGSSPTVRFWVLYCMCVILQ